MRLAVKKRHTTENGKLLEVGRVRHVSRDAGLKLLEKHPDRYEEVKDWNTWSKEAFIASLKKQSRKKKPA